MSAEREELSTIISDSAVPRDGVYRIVDHIAADDVLAAGYRKPHVVTTVEELDALATESIVRDVDGLPKEKQNGTGGEVFWAAPGHRKHYGNGDIWLPATVLYEPTPGGAE